DRWDTRGVGELSPCRKWLFFFSSRRRHTSSKRDWSSDVCSSDLVQPSRGHVHGRGQPAATVRLRRRQLGAGQRRGRPFAERLRQIGRASCRERVWKSVVAGRIKKTTSQTSNGAHQAVSSATTSPD